MGFNYSKHHGEMRAKRAYRALRLAVLIHQHADERGRWAPPSKVFLRRALASDGENTCTPADVDTAIRQLRSQGVITQNSDQAEFILTGSEGDE
ncbi:hypothetical protein I8D64_14005 [Brachybacterium sp. MASK1Z-5]|uniref:Uncharacterized protein n=1 Tax=Brachybacterium halotolerans TaxID=2795215 RepID=A0ABS1BCY4_9MICO|nr:hypothetical protein [Brachybacterium halotolerans]MBK0332510.1 hypothetical protein [Brachybacterium halotolerans]